MDLADEKLQEIRDRHLAAPRGPWRWTGYTGSNQIHLSTRYDSLMEFERWGMQSAQPVFNTDGLLYRASELVTPDTAPARGRVTGIEHPVARVIAHSWQDVADLLDEVDRLRALLAVREQEGR